MIQYVFSMSDNTATTVEWEEVLLALIMAYNCDGDV